MVRNGCIGEGTVQIEVHFCGSVEIDYNSRKNGYLLLIGFSEWDEPR